MPSFLGRGRINPFVYLSIVFVIYGITVSEQYVFEFPGIQFFLGISSILAAFLFLIFLSTMSRSSSVNCPSLTSMIKHNKFKMILGGFLIKVIQKTIAHVYENKILKLQRVIQDTCFLKSSAIYISHDCDESHLLINIVQFARCVT